MQGGLPGVVVLIVIFFQRGLAVECSGNQDGTNSCSSAHCSIEDEGPCKDDGETKLYRWDPVKVCNFVYFKIRKQVLKFKFIYNTKLSWFICV